MLFEVVVVEEPTKEQKNAGELERVVFGVELVVANDQESAKTQVLVKNGAKINGDVNRLRVYIRPFAPLP